MQVPPHQGEGEKDKDKGNDPRRAAEHDGGDGGEGWGRWIHGIGEWMSVGRQMKHAKHGRRQTPSSAWPGWVVVEQAVVYVSCLASSLAHPHARPVCPPLGPSQTRTLIPHYALSIRPGATSWQGHHACHVFSSVLCVCGYVSIPLASRHLWMLLLFHCYTMLGWM